MFCKLLTRSQNLLKQNGRKVFHTLRYHAGLLFSVDFFLNFLKSLLLRLMFPAKMHQRELKGTLLFSQIFCFDAGSYFKENYQKVSPKFAAILPRQGKSLNLGSSANFTVGTFVRTARKSCSSLNRGQISGTRNNDCRTLLIKTDNSHKQSIIIQTTNCYFQKVGKGRNKVENNGVFKVVVVFTITGRNYLVVVLFCDMKCNAPFSYLYFRSVLFNLFDIVEPLIYFRVCNGTPLTKI